MNKKLNKIIPETILQSFHFQHRVFYFTDITRSDITESFTSDLIQEDQIHVYLYCGATRDVF